MWSFLNLQPFAPISWIFSISIWGPDSQIFNAFFPACSQQFPTVFNVSRKYDDRVFRRFFCTVGRSGWYFLFCFLFWFFTCYLKSFIVSRVATCQNLPMSAKDSAGSALNLRFDLIALPNSSCSILLELRWTRVTKIWKLASSHDSTPPSLSPPSRLPRYESFTRFAHWSSSSSPSFRIRSDWS